MKSNKGEKMFKVTLSVLILGLSVTAFAAPNIKTEKVNGKERKYEADHLIVKFKEGISETEETALLKKHKSDKAQSFKGIDKMHRIKVPPGQEKKIKAELEASGKVEFVELNEAVPADLSTNDPQSGWHLQNISAPAAWDISTGANPTVVAILDTGVDINHPDLAGRTVPGFNVIDNNTNITDIQGHGTAVAGSAVVASNNGVGIASQCWGCKIMPVRIAYLQNGGAWATYSAIATGMQWAVNNGAKVINVSYGNMYNGQAVASAANYVKNKGGLVFISMGNENAYIGSAVASEIIYVGATNSGNNKAWFSNHGPIVTLSAPGEGILSTSNGGGYGHWNGTSFAAPMAAGTAALIWSAKPSLSMAAVRKAVLTGVDDLGPAGRDNEFGAGKINAVKALKIALGTTPSPTPTPNPTPSPVTWTKCADENQFCSFTGTRDVRYGTDTVFATKTFTNGVACTNAIFGDPVYGTVKKCSYGALK